MSALRHPCRGVRAARAGSGSRGGYASALLAASALLLLLLPGAAAAQAIRGRVIDAQTGASIARAEVVLRMAAGRSAGVARTDEDGSFFIAAASHGEYVLDATHPDYAAMQAVALRIAEQEVVVVDLRLARSVIALDPLTVTARRRDVRHDATLDGALARRELFPPRGSRRVLMHGDPELVAAQSVAHVLNWMPQSLFGGCRIMFWNGSLERSPEDAQAWLEITPRHVRAIEYYRTWHDAPLSLRDTPAYIASPSRCSVIALWQETEVPARRRGWWLYAAAVSAGMLLLAALPVIF